MAFVVIKMPIGGTRVDFIEDLLTRDDKLRFETVMIIVEVVKSCLAATGPAHDTISIFPWLKTRF